MAETLSLFPNQGRQRTDHRAGGKHVRHAVLHRAKADFFSRTRTTGPGVVSVMPTVRASSRSFKSSCTLVPRCSSATRQLTGEIIGIRSPCHALQEGMAAMNPTMRPASSLCTQPRKGSASRAGFVVHQCCMRASQRSAGHGQPSAVSKNVAISVRREGGTSSSRVSNVKLMYRHGFVDGAGCQFVAPEGFAG